MTARHDDRPPVRVGLVGYSLGGATFHAPFLATTPGVELSAIVTGDAERAAQAAARHPAARVVPDMDALLALAPELDVAVIATPNRTHAPLAHAALDAGLHVVVDKPLATSAAEAAALVEHGARAGRLVVPYQNRRWDGDFRTVQRLLAEGALGRPLRLESAFERWRPALRDGWRESDAPEDAGGLLFDLGTHLIDQACVLFGPVARVYAELAARRAGGRVTDDVFLSLAHAGGARTHLRVTALAGVLAPRFRLLGDAGAYVKHGVDVQEAALRVGERPGGDAWGVEPTALWGAIGAGDAPRPVPTERGDWGRYHALLRDAVRGEGPPPVDARDAVHVLAVIEAAQRSAAAGTAEDVRV